MYEPIKEEIYTIVRKSYKKNRMKELIKGAGEYQIELVGYTPKMIPTDWYGMYICGLYPFFRINRKIKNKFLKAICKVSDEGSEGVYCAFMTIVWSRICEKTDKDIVTFTIPNEVINYVYNNYKKYEKQLKNNTSYMGKYHDDGLFEEIEMLSRSFKVFNI